MPRLPVNISIRLALLVSICVAGWARAAESVAPPSQARAGRPLLTCQAQFYPLAEKATGYISRWHDVPLLLDNSLPKGGKARCEWSGEQMDVSVRELLEYGFDGFSFFPTSYNRFGAFDLLAAGHGKGAVLVPILHPCLKGSRYSADDIWSHVCTNPGFEIDGKKVIFAYKTMAFAGKDPAALATGIAETRRRYGDRFLFMADMEFLTRLHYAYAARGRLSADEAAAAREEIRKWLRVADGAYYGEVHMLHRYERDERKFFADFYRDGVIAVIRSVLDEPEFRGRKLLGLSALIGHENDCQWGYYCSHDGTKTLRRSLATAIAGRPDYINFCEWDEVNENTCICPTFRNARSTKRILRQAFGELRGKSSSPMPGDDTSVPNLIVSARAVVAYGEALDVEVLNVPDGSTGEIDVRLAVLDESGKVLKELEPAMLSAERLEDHTFSIASETLAPHRVARYRLTVDRAGRRQTWEEGLPFTELRTVAAWHYRWNKVPLRELIPGVRCRLKASPAPADGLVPLAVAIAADEPLAYVNVIENDEIVSVHDPSGFEDTWREDASNWVFAVTFFSDRDIHTQGTLQASGLGGSVEWRTEGGTAKGSSLPLMRISKWCSDILLKVPKSAALADAEVVADAPEMPNVRIPLAAVVRYGAFNRPAMNGMSMTVDRFRFQEHFPARRLSQKDTRFVSSVLPSADDSVLHVLAVSESGRVWRSAPLSLGVPPVGEKTITVRSATEQKAVKIAVPACQAPKVGWDFSGVAGNFIPNRGGGRYQAAILGAPASVATFANRYSGHLCSNPFKIPEYILKPPTDGPSKAPRTYPLRLREDGTDFLRFAKWSSMLLPQGVLPRNAGWTLSFKMRPKAIGGIQTPFACRWGKGTPGSFWMSILDDGHLRLDYAGLANIHTRREYPVKVKAGEWNEVKVRYAVDSISLELGSWKSGPAPCVSPGRHDLLVMIGGYDGEWFTGDIADLCIEVD